MDLITKLIRQNRHKNLLQKKQIEEPSKEKKCKQRCEWGSKELKLFEKNRHSFRKLLICYKGDAFISYSSLPKSFVFMPTQHWVFLDESFHSDLLVYYPTFCQSFHESSSVIYSFAVEPS